MFKKYLPQIVAMLFLAGFAAYAWTEPSSVPPAGNVDAPLNVGSSDQTFSGSKTLWMKSDETGTMNLRGAFNVRGFSQFLSDAIFDGNVCIGGVCKNTWPASQPRKAIFSAPGAYSFLVPGGITKVWVVLAGGGGGGGGGGNSSGGSAGCAAGGGGGGDAVVMKELTVISGTNYTITVGQGGPGGISSSILDEEFGILFFSTNGGDGSASSFGSLLTTHGGKGGQTGSASCPALGGNAGGPGGVKGSSGSDGYISGGDGGGSIFVLGGLGGCCSSLLNGAVSGDAGGGSGGGGGGGSGVISSGSKVGGQGSPGSPGFVIIDY